MLRRHGVEGGFGREDVEFAAEGDVTLRGWLFLPDAAGVHPGITIAHGYSGVREHGLERFARVFAAQIGWGAGILMSDRALTST